MKGKLIVIEGCDCSGKETQSCLLVDYLNSIGKKAIRFSFPMYNTPTGKIIEGPLLGKETVCKSYFEEKSSNLDSKVAALYFAADRYYNKEVIEEYLSLGYYVILDRYIHSNMAHQGCKYESAHERLNLYHFIEDLEYDLLKLPKPNQVIFLYLPYTKILELLKNRNNLDDNEKDDIYLKSVQKTYMELSNIYNFDIIECAHSSSILSIEDIHEKIKKIII